MYICFMTGIYKITSPSGRIYVGQSVDISIRFKNYKSLSNCRRQTRLYASFLKYGVNIHVFEILEFCSIIELNNRERYYQELFNCIGRKGLNCKYVNTSIKKGRLSEETKQKIREVKKGFKHTEKSKLLVKQNNAKYWLGKKRPATSEDTKRKISISNSGKKRCPETGFKIANSISKILLSDAGIFYTYKEASFVYGIKETTIRAMVLGQNKNKTNLTLTKKH